jgi:pyrroline-5-carboxylate reductase
MGLGDLNRSVGFIGAGQMAEALARGFIARGVVKASAMVATDPVQARRDVFESFNVKPVESNAEVAASHALCCFSRTHQVIVCLA